MSAPDLSIAADEYSLLTDLYQLTMIACYCGEGLENRPASFELFARRLPDGFGYLIAAGLEQALSYLENLHFSEAQILALEKTGLFPRAPDKFWDLLARGRFTGDVFAVAEGTAIFANEPLLRVTAPLWQAQLVETFLLNTINYQTLIGTRAARLRDIAGDEAILMEFGTRRAFSPQGSMWAARAAIACGLDNTSNVLAALKLGQKPSGTMAHSLVMAIGAIEGSEDDAFAAFDRYFPGATLLIDTYDTLAAAERLAESGKKVTGVRLDSGDLVELSQKVRQLLPETKIFASGDLDEYEIDRLQKADACIDGYGIGTRLVTGSPVNGVYKLVEIDGRPTMKRSSQKATYPGNKQIFRHRDNGIVTGDRLGLAIESPEEGEIPLLERVMKDGKRLFPNVNLETIQKRARSSVRELPPIARQLDNPAPLPVTISKPLQTLHDSLLSRF